MHDGEDRDCVFTQHLERTRLEVDVLKKNYRGGRMATVSKHGVEGACLSCLHV